MMDLNSLLNELLQRGGSDLHLIVGQPPVFRIDGDLIRHEGEAVDEATMNALLLPSLSDAQRATLTEHGIDVETMLRVEGRSFRFHVFRERGRLGATVRPVPQGPPALEDLYPDSSFRRLMESLIKQPRGLIIVTGPAGCGKTTTCISMLETINRTARARIVTIEDPVSYEMVSKESVISQRSVGHGQDVHSFENGAFWAFHEDIDVIFIGELRTLDTLQYALALAESGHLVISQLHVDSASEAVNRIIEVFPEPRDLIRRLVARCLIAVISQKLLPRADRPGRVAANEALVVTPRIRKMVLEGQTDLTLAVEAGRTVGMQTMDDSLLELYRDGVISYETAWLHIGDRDRLGPFAKRAS